MVLSGTNNRFIILIIIAGALLIRIGVFSYFTVKGYEPQMYEYDDIALNLAEGEGFLNVYMGAEFYSCTTPLYPFICALFFKLFGLLNHTPIMLFQIIVSSCTCLILFYLGRKLSGDPAGIIAAGLYAVHPGFIIYSTAKLHPLVLDSFLFLLTLAAFIGLVGKTRMRDYLLTGMLVGLCMLSRSTVIAFVPIGLIWIMVLKKSPLKKLISCFSVLFAGILIIVLPWSVRNYIVHGQFIFITSTDAEVFWRGNNINASGSSHMDGRKMVLEGDKSFSFMIPHFGETEKRYIFRERTGYFLRDHTCLAVLLFFKKLYYFWWFSPTVGVQYPKGYVIPYRLFYIALLVSAILGMRVILKTGNMSQVENFVMLLLFVLSVSFFQSMFYVEGRHRWGIEPMLMLLSGTGIVYLIRSIITGRGDKEAMVCS